MSRNENDHIDESVGLGGVNMATCNFKCQYLKSCNRDKLNCEECKCFLCSNCLSDRERCNKSSEELFLDYIKATTETLLTVKLNVEITKDDLIKWCEEIGLDRPKVKDTKIDIANNLLKNGIAYLEFYERFSYKAYGIHPSRFSNKFEVNQYQRKKMESTGFIDILYSKNEKIFTGRYGNVPYYNPKWYFSISQKDIEKWRYKHIKGYEKNKQIKLDI